jgi:two-component system phosphate regulon sensor histidine kinase PhoR
VRLLVVDDEEGMREGMRRILERAGHEVETAANGEEALRRLAGPADDIALVDLKMPGVDGFRVTRFANEQAGDRTVVVIVSALATVEAAVEVVRHGAFDFLVKPFVPADLLAVVERASRQRRLMAERETYLSELNSERTLSRQMIDSLRDGVIVLNVKARPVLMNTRAEYLLGIAFREDLGLTDLGLEGPAQAMIEDVLAAHGGGEYHQLRLERGGTVLDVRATPWLRQGEKAGLIVQLGDVTEQARIESDKNRFISMVAHELTSPLAAISSYLAIVLAGTLDGQPDRIKEIMGRSKARADALLELVKDLQYLNRREAGRVTRTVEHLDVAEVLRGQLDFYRVQAERRSVDLRLEVAPGDTTANADRGDLDRVFMNLISNGIKYNREGGTLTVRVVPHPDRLEISFADTGIGMSETERAGLFQEFYRVHNPLTQGISGTGLGLATVRRVLAAANGSIDLRSTPGEGSTFTVMLPRGGAPSD